MPNKQGNSQPAAVPEALSDLQHRLQFARQDAANFKLMTEELVELAGWLGASTPKGHETKVRILAKAKSLLGGITIKGEFPKVGE